MKISNTIFGKDLYDLVYADLVAYFELQKDETLNLEFKSYVSAGDFHKKVDAIKKSTCALLNSEGGIIIWGAPNEVKDEHGNTSAIGDLTPFETEFDRDRLINALTASITPMPSGIRVQKLTNEDNTSVFVIEVEKSLGRPHQFKDRYYIRLDGQTRIAPHYLISAMMKSVDFPDLKGYVRLKRIEHNNAYFLLHFRSLLVNSSYLVNDTNVFETLYSGNGNLYIDGINYGNQHRSDFPIISNGTPFMNNFIVMLTKEEIHEEIDIVFQFGGEKSPAKASNYKYQFLDNIPLGNVNDENIFILEKNENKFAFEISQVSFDDGIEMMLND
jgi:hypothetical protein